MLACRFCGQQANLDKPAYLLEQLDYDANSTVYNACSNPFIGLTLIPREGLFGREYN